MVEGCLARWGARLLDESHWVGGELGCKDLLVRLVHQLHELGVHGRDIAGHRYIFIIVLCTVAAVSVFLVADLEITFFVHGVLGVDKVVEVGCVGALQIHTFLQVNFYLIFKSVCITLHLAQLTLLIFPSLFLSVIF